MVAVCFICGGEDEERAFAWTCKHCAQGLCLKCWSEKRIRVASGQSLLQRLEETHTCIVSRPLQTQSAAIDAPPGYLLVAAKWNDDTGMAALAETMAFRHPAPVYLLCTGYESRAAFDADAAAAKERGVFLCSPVTRLQRIVWIPASERSTADIRVSTIICPNRRAYTDVLLDIRHLQPGSNVWIVVAKDSTTVMPGADCIADRIIPLDAAMEGMYDSAVDPATFPPLRCGTCGDPVPKTALDRCAHRVRCDAHATACLTCVDVRRAADSVHAI